MKFRLPRDVFGMILQATCDPIDLYFPNGVFSDAYNLNIFILPKKLLNFNSTLQLKLFFCICKFIFKDLNSKLISADILLLEEFRASFKV